METWTLAAIFVSIFGVCIILAIVWLFYKWRALRLSPGTPYLERSASPDQRYVVEKGRMVPVYYHPSPNMKSGLASLRHTSWFLSATTLHKSDHIRTPDRKSNDPSSFETSPDLEAGQWHKEAAVRRKPKASPRQTRNHRQKREFEQQPPLAARHTIQRPTNSYQRSIHQTPPDPSHLGPTPYERSPRTPRQATKSMGRSPALSRYSFLDPPSPESLPQRPPMPPHLAPLQSRYHIAPPPYISRRHTMAKQPQAQSFVGDEPHPDEQAEADPAIGG